MKKVFLFLCALVLVWGVAGTAGAASVTYQPGPAAGKDAMIVSGYYANGNYGNNLTITANMGSGTQVRGLIEFDLSDLSALPGVNITSATLELYHDANTGAGAIIGLYRNTSSWDEATVTWNTAPTHDGMVSVLNIPDSDWDVWRSWDVTGIVGDWVSGTYDNYGLTIIRTDLPAFVIYLDSSDYPNSLYYPKLTVEYETVPLPSAAWLLCSGLVGLLGVRRKFKKN